MKIQFKNVGRGKANWVAEIDTDRPDSEVADDIATEIMNNGRLMSQDVSGDWDDEFNGSIYAGFHKVGSFGPVKEEA